MALLDTPRPIAPFASVVGRGFDGAQRLMGTLQAWNDARRTRAALSQLSAHELQDLGLTHGDIERIRF